MRHDPCALELGDSALHCATTLIIYGCGSYVLAPASDIHKLNDATDSKEWGLSMRAVNTSLLRVLVVRAESGINHNVETLAMGMTVLLCNKYATSSGH